MRELLFYLLVCLFISFSGHVKGRSGSALNFIKKFRNCCLKDRLNLEIIFVWIPNCRYYSEKRIWYGCRQLTHFTTNWVEILWIKLRYTENPKNVRKFCFHSCMGRAQRISDLNNDTGIHQLIDINWNKTRFQLKYRKEAPTMAGRYSHTESVWTSCYVRWYHSLADVTTPARWAISRTTRSTYASAKVYPPEIVPRRPPYTAQPHYW